MNTDIFKKIRDQYYYSVMMLKKSEVGTLSYRVYSDEIQRYKNRMRSMILGGN